MKIIALALLALGVTTARADQWCISRTGRLRLRPTVCSPNERPFAFGAPLLTLLDRTGHLVGHLAGLGTGYELSYGSVFVTRTAADGALIGFRANAAGIVAPGADVLYFTGAGCVGEPLIADYDNAEHGLVKVGPAWATAVWYPQAGTGRDTASESLLFPVLPGSAPCSDYPTGTPMADDLCCVDAHYTGRYFTAARFAPADAGLEPPFRLSVEP